jgi:hypothetical protein
VTILLLARLMWSQLPIGSVLLLMDVNTRQYQTIYYHLTAPYMISFDKNSNFVNSKASLP